MCIYVHARARAAPHAPSGAARGPPPVPRAPHPAPLAAVTQLCRVSCTPTAAAAVTSRRARASTAPFNAMPPNTYFTRSKDKILIEMVRKNPVMYDDRHDHSKDAAMKHCIWKAISAAIDVPVPVVKKRWRHFRDHYLKKCRERAARGGRGRQTWEHMERLQFLAFLAQGQRPPSPCPAREKIVYVLPPGEHDFSEPEEGASERGPSPETVEICASPAAARAADAPEVLVLAPAPPSGYCSPPPPPRPPPGPTAGGRSAMHKFFESMADIVVKLPPALAAEARLQVCQLVNELESRALVAL